METQQQKHSPVFRSLGEVRIPEKEAGDNSRKVQFAISTEARDRHGTIIKLSAWDLKAYNKNGIVAYQHKTSSSWFLEEDFNPDNIIGKGKAWLDNESKTLMGEVEFEPGEINPLAEKIYQKVLFGTLKAVSVGFMSRKGHWGVQRDGEDTGTYYFDDVELLEFSVVNIPSNPEAIKKEIESRTLEFLKPKEEESQSSTVKLRERFNISRKISKTRISNEKINRTQGVV